MLIPGTSCAVRSRFAGEETEPEGGRGLTKSQAWNSSLSSIQAAPSFCTSLPPCADSDGGHKLEQGFLVRREGACWENTVYKLT